MMGLIISGGLLANVYMRGILQLETDTALVLPC